MIPREPHVLAHFLRKDLNHYFAIVVEGCFPVAFVGQTALEDTESLLSRGVICVLTVVIKVMLPTRTVVGPW